jgi:uncharacterized membrane protein YhdT
MNKDIDPGSRDYEFSDIEMDERFVQIFKEWLVTIAVFIVHMTLVIANLYILGKDPANYVYVGGFPLWIVLMVSEFVLLIVTVFVVVDKVFRHMDIEPTGKLHSK